MKNILETGTWIVHLFLGDNLSFSGVAVVYLFSLNEKQIRNSDLDNLFFCHLLFTTMRLFAIFLFDKSGESHLSPSRDCARQIDARFLRANLGGREVGGRQINIRRFLCESMRRTDLLYCPG